MFILLEVLVTGMNMNIYRGVSRDQVFPLVRSCEQCILGIRWRPECCCSDSFSFDVTMQESCKHSSSVDRFSTTQAQTGSKVQLLPLKKK